MFNVIGKSGFYTFILFFWLGLSPIQSIDAQKIIEIPEPELDSSYVKLDYKKWSFRVFAALWYHNINLKNEQNEKVSYYPKSPFSIGLGFSYRFLVIDIGLRIKRELKSTRFDFQTQFVIKHNLIDVLFQNYTGFQKKRKKLENSYRDDIRSSILTLTHFYIVHNKKLSLNSTLSGNRIQRKSAGTMLLGSFLSYNRVRADSSLIPRTKNGDFNSFAQIVDSKSFNFGTYVGYAYNWVLPNKFFIFSSISPGIGLNIGKVEAEESYKPPLFPVGKLYARISIGKIFTKSYIILGLASNITILDMGHGNSYIHNAGQFKLVFGYRFKNQNKFTKKIDETF